MSRYGLTKGVSLLRIFNRRLKCRTSNPNRSRSDVDTTDLETAKDCGEPFAHTLIPAKNCTCWDSVSVVDHLNGLKTPVTEFSDIFTNSDSAISDSGVFLDHEASNAFFGASSERNQTCAFPICYPCLRAGYYILIAVPHCPTGDIPRIRSRIWFGER